MKSKFKKQDPPFSKLPKFMPGDIVKFYVESKEETVFALVEYVRVHKEKAEYNLIGWHTAFPESRLNLIEKKEGRTFITHHNHE